MDFIFQSTGRDLDETFIRKCSFPEPDKTRQATKKSEYFEFLRKIDMEEKPAWLFKELSGEDQAKWRDPAGPPGGLQTCSHIGQVLGLKV